MDILEKIKTEVLVIGGGGAGICAAISARIEGADVVRSLSLHAPQQIGICMVLMVPLAQIGSRAQPGDTHTAHQPKHPLFIHYIAHILQHCTDPPVPIVRPAGIDLVYPVHQLNILVFFIRRPVVYAGGG